MQKVEANSAKSYAKLTPLIQFQDEVAAGTGELPSPLPSVIHSLCHSRFLFSSSSVLWTRPVRGL
jgi:hypothetical protein